MVHLSTYLAVSGFCLMFISCLKNSDNTSDGPKGQVAITNYGINGPVAIQLDNTPLTTAALAYGTGISTGTGGYTSLPAGLHNIQALVGSTVIFDKTLSITAGLHYSYFCFDTLAAGKVKSLLLTDDLTAIDTLGRLRFISFIPGTDSLALTIKKDTSYTVSDTYVGNKSIDGVVAFSQGIRPGAYDLTLTRKGTILYQRSGVSMVAGKIYSLIARGLQGGTGDYKESVTVIQHN